jgi:hypothetical protein
MLVSRWEACTTSWTFARQMSGEMPSDMLIRKKKGASLEACTHPQPRGRVWTQPYRHTHAGSSMATMLTTMGIQNVCGD